MVNTSNIINVRLEGGLGDVLLGNRLVCAVKEKHPGLDIVAYLDTEGNEMQKQALLHMYPFMYKEVHTIPSKKYKPFWVNTQYGPDQGFGAFENIPNEWQEKIKNPLWYDLHIDGMKWCNNDLPWKRYYNYFPPAFCPIKKHTGQVLLHISSDSSTGHNLEPNYVKELTNYIKLYHHIKVIVTAKTKLKYKLDNYLTGHEMIEGDLTSIIDAIASCNILLTIDSGLKHVASCYGKPTITWSQQCYAPGKVLPSHQVRWLLEPQTCVPLNYNIKYVDNLLNKITWNPIASIVPDLTDVKQQLVFREYAVDTTKSILQ